MAGQIEEVYVGTAFQGIFIVAGIALVIAGASGNRPLQIFGIGSLVLVPVGRILGRSARM